MNLIMPYHELSTEGKSIRKFLIKYRSSQCTSHVKCDQLGTYVVKKYVLYQEKMVINMIVLFCSCQDRIPTYKINWQHTWHHFYTGFKLILNNQQALKNMYM